MPRAYTTQTQALLDSRYDQLSFKASHNTYRRTELMDELLGFDRDTAYSFGCRGVEFDLHEREDGFAWCVKHTDGPGQDFAGFLRLLAQWSDAHAEHDPILVTLDVKKLDDSGGLDRLDRYLDDQFDPDRMLKPDTVRPLGERSIQWPRLGDMKDKFVFCVSGANEDEKYDYAARDGRLCFADRSEDPATLSDRVTIDANYADEPRVFLNCNAGPWITLPRSQGREYALVLPAPGYITRVWTVDSQDHWGVCRRMGFNVIGTDHLADPWGCFTPPDAYAPRLAP